MSLSIRAFILCLLFNSPCLWIKLLLLPFLLKVILQPATASRLQNAHWNLYASLPVYTACRHASASAPTENFFQKK